MQHRDELSKFVGDEISRIVVEQRQLEARYEQLITERGELKGLANKAKYKEVQNEIAEVSRQLREATKQLCRNLKDNPNIQSNLLKIQRERTELIEVRLLHVTAFWGLLSLSLFVDVLGNSAASTNFAPWPLQVLVAGAKELKEKGTYGPIVAACAAAHEATERAATVVERERIMAAAVQSLDRELTEEKAAHQAAMAAQRETIEALKVELQRVKSSATVEAEYVRRSELGQTGGVVRVQSKAELEASRRIAALREKLAMEVVCHEEAAAFLTRKAHAVAQEQARWTARAEEEGAAKDRELEAAREKQLASRERLDALQARKAADDAAEQVRLDGLAAAAAAAVAAAAAEARANVVVAKVQKLVRAFLKRAAERNAGGKKKKGGGKKGKKKK